MIDVYTGTEVRAAERPLLDAGQGPALMKRAAHGLAQHIAGVLRGRRGRVYGSRVVAFVGTGNNGGDGLHALAMLRRRGVAVTAIQTADRCHAEGLAAFQAAGGRLVPWEGSLASPPARSALATADVVVDAVLGTGAQVPEPGDGGADAPRPAPLSDVELPPRAYVVACDLPSGVDADTGAALPGTLRADSTVTFGALKTGLVVGRGATLSGRVEVVDIGLGEHLGTAAVRLFEPDDAVDTAPARDAHKYSRGVLGLIAGSDEYPGAAVLAATSAVNAGLGMLYTVTTGRARDAVTAAVPESVVLEGSALEEDQGPAGRVSAWAVGPGIGDAAQQSEAVAAVLASASERGTPCVVDASTLKSLKPGQTRSDAPFAVLTPHAGELRGLLINAGVDVSGDAVAHDPVKWALRAARDYGAVVLLKGATTVCATPTGEILMVTGAPPTLATAGSGDVLTGLLGQMLATVRPTAVSQLLVCAASAASRHAAIARSLGTHGFGASRLAASIE
ncbi:NAD(P)H-hydrate dehydratase [Zhihengliuella sp.]|uniref:NAD(P)H-hydrate dehydratase n=1 Tax=Zhihengliuella sp. TaxID=1954483 RepID=UPI0028122B8F|nr:NAD(P)H-hydrate dehydratase [Zhihengliuella sp.]